MYSPATQNDLGFQIITEQFVENASFLWELYAYAQRQPHYFCDDISALQNRIDSNIQGLLSKPQDVWPLCLSALELEGPGDIFISTIVALRQQDHTKLQYVVNLALHNSERTQAFASALTWDDSDINQFWINKLLHSKDLNHKYLALEACSIIRRDPGEYLHTLLSREDCQQHEKLMCSALRLIGELKKQSLAPELAIRISASNPQEVFWASWSTVILGQTQTVIFQQANQYLQNYLLGSGPNLWQALNLVFCTISIKEGRELIKKISKCQDQRLVIQAVALLGDPQAVPWLMELMHHPESARQAAEAFRTIVGIDIEQLQLDAEAPEEPPSGPNDDPNDDNTAMDEDENLPWPNPSKLAKEWNNIAYQFNDGERYFMGEKPTKTQCLKLFASAPQRHRHLCALHLAVSGASEAFLNANKRAH